MNRGIDLIKKRINEQAYLLVKSAKSEKELTDTIEKCLEKIYYLEQRSDELSPELIEKLNRIYNYFGGRKNKMDKLFQEYHSIILKSEVNQWH